MTKPELALMWLLVLVGLGAFVLGGITCANSFVDYVDMQEAS